MDINSEDFERIIKIIERDNVRDKLLNYLIKYIHTDWDNNYNGFIQNIPYEKLSKILDETEENNGIKAISEYLNEKIWYYGHKNEGWYDDYKDLSINTYSGYWAWETAAIVKIKGWNDDALKGLDYYPYDAVHW